MQQDLPKKEYEWNLCLCFWFAVHMKYIEFVKFMVDFDTNLKKIVYFSKKIGTKNSSIGGDDFSQDRDDSKDKNNHTNVGLMGNRVISKDEQSPVRLDQEKERSLQEDSEEEDWKQEGGENDDEDEGEGEQKDMNKVEPIQDNPTRQDINMMIRTDSSKRSNKLSQSSRNKKYDTEESQKRNSKYGKILDEEVSKKDEEDNDAESVKEKEKDLSKSFSSKSISVKGDKRNQSEGSAKILMTDPLLGQVINGIDIEKITLDDEESLERVRFFLQNQAQVFIGNVLVLLVKENEEELACILCQYYKCNPQLELIERIVTKGFWTLLKYMWKYDKRPSDHLDVNNPDVFSFDDLLKFFKEYTKTEEEYFQYINKISGWKLKCKDNFLKGLLAHNHDDIALEQMGKYFHEMNQELLIFCLDKGKENFLNQSLYAFNKFIFRQDEVVEKLLELLKNGSQLNSYLNILTLVDISIWKINQIKALINIFEGYAYHEYETNQLLLSYNPLMTIALTCEILTHISNNKKKVAKSSNKVKRDLLALGQMFTSKIEDEDYYETLITDLDSRGRSLLKIITDNEFEPLMDDKDPKAENIMMSIYQGKEATKCDGSVKGYSSIYHFITTNPKKLEATDKGSKIFKFFKNYFEPNYNFDYSFQYRYRAHSINFIFMKEFLCSIALLVIFQYISYQYLTLFNIDNLSTNLTDTQLREKVTKNLSTYRGYNLLAFMCSFSLVFHILLKMLFNLCTKNTKKLPVDKWTILDAVTAILYVVSIFVISNVSVDTLLNSKKKSYLDYFILLVLCATWIRTFSFFLVVSLIIVNFFYLSNTRFLEKYSNLSRFNS